MTDHPEQAAAERYVRAKMQQAREAVAAGQYPTFGAALEALLPIAPADPFTVAALELDMREAGLLDDKEGST